MTNTHVTPAASSRADCCAHGAEFCAVHAPERAATPREAFDRIRDRHMTSGADAEHFVGYWGWTVARNDRGDDLTRYERLYLTVPVMEYLARRGLLRREFGGSATYGDISYYSVPAVAANFWADHFERYSNDMQAVTC